MAKRGYSRDFRPHADTGKRYLLDKIPAGLWTDVRTKARRQGISLRALLLQLVTEWKDRDEPPATGEAPAARPRSQSHTKRRLP